MLPPPSTEKLPLRLLPPPTISDSHANDAVDDCSWMPGASDTAASQLRLRIGSAASSWLLMLVATCVEVTSIIGDSPVTVMFCSSVPTSSVISSDRLLPTCSSRPCALELAEPGKLGLDAVWPGHEARGEVRPIGIADDVPKDAAAFVRDQDRHAGQRGSRGIDNLSLDGRLSLLCKRRTDEHQQPANGNGKTTHGDPL